MTEAEWLACTDPKPMLAHLHPLDRVSGRKWRLFAVACSRVNFARLLKGTTRWLTIEPVLNAALEQIDRHAEGKLDYEALRDVLQVIRKSSPDLTANACVFPEWLNRAALRDPYEAACSMDWPLTRKTHADLVRCLFGNPFRPPLQLSVAGEAAKLALSIDERRSFEEMPALADALQAEGCEDGEVLAHCRAPGDHARGCWVVDLLLPLAA